LPGKVDEKFAFKFTKLLLAFKIPMGKEFSEDYTPFPTIQILSFTGFEYRKMFFIKYSIMFFI